MFVCRSHGFDLPLPRMWSSELNLQITTHPTSTFWDPHHKIIPSTSAPTCTLEEHVNTYYKCVCTVSNQKETICKCVHVKQTTMLTLFKVCLKYPLWHCIQPKGDHLHMRIVLKLWTVYTGCCLNFCGVSLFFLLGSLSTTWRSFSGSFICDLFSRGSFLCQNRQHGYVITSLAWDKQICAGSTQTSIKSVFWIFFAHSLARFLWIFFYYVW